MNDKPTIGEIFQSERDTLPYLVEGAIIGFTEEVVGRMQILDLNRTALASKLGSSPAYVTKMLGGGTNFTLESMVKVSEALDTELKIVLVPKVSIQDWAELIEKNFSVRRPEVQALQAFHHRTKDVILGPFCFDQPEVQNEILAIAN